MNITQNSVSTQPVFSSVSTSKAAILAADPNIEPDAMNVLAAVHDYDWQMLPDGFIKAVAHYNYNSAFLPVHQMAITSGLMLMAAVCGRAYNTPTDAGLNIYVSLISDTGTGKESIKETVTAFINKALPLTPLLESEVIASAFASKQGALRHLSEMHYPCCVSFIDEYGLYLQRINNPSLSDTVAREMCSFWLEAFSSNKPNGILPGISYSDKGKNIKNLMSPSVSVCGWSTPDNYYKGVDDANIADGMMPRNIFVHYKGERPEDNNRRISMPENYLHWFRQIAQCAKEIEMAGMRVACRYVSDEVEAMAKGISEHCRSIMNNSNDSITKLLYNRAHLNILKIASLLAVARDHKQPYILAEHLTYAQWFVMQGIDDVIERFESGRVGQHVGADPVTEQQKVLLSEIKKYKESSWTARFGITNRVTLEQFEQQIVNYQYFNANVRTKKQFRKSYDSEQALKNCLEWAVASGILSKLSGQGKMFQIMPDGWSHAVPAVSKKAEGLGSLRV